MTLVSATELAQSSSYWAQGGLAAALSADDSPQLHLADTLSAGRGMVRESAARVLTDEAPAAVEDLARLGVQFDGDGAGRPALSLEGGHGMRRIVHAGGAATGRRIVQQLSELAAAEPRIEVLEDRRAVALLMRDGRCTGVVLAGGQELNAPATTLATGGTAALWSRTTNPSAATGGGLLLAHAAAAKLADIEMMQFHPTAVVASGRYDGLLVTEAIRGEGARLLNAQGERFVEELAPRDEVARAIYAELVRCGSRSVALDMREVDPRLFPTVIAALAEAGLDATRETIPVAPAAHYMMGGIATDLEAGTSVPGLLAIGECSCTGLHGANRLASNSLSECFVFGARAARAALAQPPLPASSAGQQRVAPEGVPAPGPESREALWRNAGLVRDAAGLTSLLDDPHPLVRLIATAALRREESRGAHWRRDFPDQDPKLDRCHVTLVTDQKAEFEQWA